ncbi:hypothetical protein FKP32DRAFT_1753479 [Trametes sanguinea]|nr:hypothetical protein FKP32DRAFT_1753479 [Trametes sanguinea]
MSTIIYIDLPIRKLIKKPALQFTTWNGEEYIVEIRKDERRDIPANWTLLSRYATFLLSYWLHL